jgi:hypothetical protein
MTWQRIAERYRSLFESMARGGHLRLAPRHGDDTSGPQRGHEGPLIPPPHASGPSGIGAGKRVSCYGRFGCAPTRGRA